MNTTNLNNFFYNNYPSLSIDYIPDGEIVGQKMRWKESYSEGTNTSYGVFVDEDGITIPYNYIMNQIYENSLIKFVNPNYEGDVWVKVVSIDSTPEDLYNYTIAINDVLDDSENYTVNEYNWSVVEGYKPFVTSFTSLLMQDLQSKISNKV